MKAVVLHQAGIIPVFTSFPEPVLTNSNQLLLKVKAVALKNIDKLRASGTHYAGYKEFPVVIGLDAVGELENGELVYAQGITGTMAEYAIIDRLQYTPLPQHIDVSVAAALPNALMGAALALRHRGKLQKGQTVLINGATGVTGKMAVQVAKLYGAGKVIATGRNQGKLEAVKALGADEVVLLAKEESEVVSDLQRIHQQHPIDLVIDYLWGNPVMLILQVLKGASVQAQHPVKIVTVGDMAGKEIHLSSAVLRSAPIEIMGSGLGSLSAAEIEDFYHVVLPEMFEHAVKGNLIIDTVETPMANIQEAWNMKTDSGKRLVLVL